MLGKLSPLYLCLALPARLPQGWRPAGGATSSRLTRVDSCLGGRSCKSNITELASVAVVHLSSTQEPSRTSKDRRTARPPYSNLASV